MIAFVTVGSTRFDSLIHSVLSTSVLSSLRLKGYRVLVVQCGNSKFDLASSIIDSQCLLVERDGIRIEIWKFKPSLQEEYERADVVISHAGSGTILEVLRLGKPLIVVPNPTLLDNHQEELASALADLGHLQCSSLCGLAQAVEKVIPSAFVPFPAFDGSRFARLLDEEMGFI